MGWDRAGMSNLVLLWVTLSSRSPTGSCFFMMKLDKWMVSRVVTVSATYQNLWPQGQCSPGRAFECAWEFDVKIEYLRCKVILPVINCFRFTPSFRGEGGFHLRAFVPRWKWGATTSARNDECSSKCSSQRSKMQKVTTRPSRGNRRQKHKAPTSSKSPDWLQFHCWIQQRGSENCWQESYTWSMSHSF